MKSCYAAIPECICSSAQLAAQMDFTLHPSWIIARAWLCCKAPALRCGAIVFIFFGLFLFILCSYVLCILCSFYVNFMFMLFNFMFILCSFYANFMLILCSCYVILFNLILYYFILFYLILFNFIYVI
jgi:hypothetical protein